MELALTVVIVCISNLQGFGILLPAWHSLSHSHLASFAHMASDALCPAMGREARGCLLNHSSLSRHIFCHGYTELGIAVSEINIASG